MNSWLVIVQSVCIPFSILGLQRVWCDTLLRPRDYICTYTYVLKDI